MLADWQRSLTGLTRANAAQLDQFTSLRVSASLSLSQVLPALDLNSITHSRAHTHTRAREQWTKFDFDAFIFSLLIATLCNRFRWAFQLECQLKDIVSTSVWVVFSFFICSLRLFKSHVHSFYLTGLWSVELFI